MTEKPKKCPGCGTKPGQIHISGCDVERCSACGSQSWCCSCGGYHDQEFARWTGFWPGHLEAAALGIDLNELYRSGLYKNFFIKPKG